jgi:hypothetical protein
LVLRQAGREFGDLPQRRPGAVIPDAGLSRVRGQRGIVAASAQSFDLRGEIADPAGQLGAPGR